MCGAEDGALRVSVLDFGLQALFDNRGSDAVLLQGCNSFRQNDSASSSDCMPPWNSPEFLGPEVWRGDFGPRCDIWACGCLMFLLLTGSMPFGSGLSFRELSQAIVHGE